MKLPREILVGDSIWTVKTVRKVPTTQGSKRENIGLCDPSTNEVLLKTGLDARERLETFLHEVLHCIEFEYEMELGHKIIYALQGPIAQFLIDNFLGPV